MTNAGWFIGLELAPDHSALSVVQRIFERGKIFCFVNSCSYVETNYGRMAVTINATAEQFHYQENNVKALIVNSTTVGRPIVNLLKSGLVVESTHFLNVLSWCIEDRQSNPWRIPILDIVGAMQVLMQTGQFRIEQHPFAEFAIDRSVLSNALREFKVEVTASPTGTPGVWGEGPHRALVMSVAIACWAAIHPDLYPTSTDQSAMLT